MGIEVRLRFLVRSREDHTKCLLTASVSEAEASSLWFRGRPANLRSLYSTWAWQTARAGVDGKQNCALNVSCISKTMLLCLAKTYMTVAILEWREKAWHHLNNAWLCLWGRLTLPVYFLFIFASFPFWLIMNGPVATTSLHSAATETHSLSPSPACVITCRQCVLAEGSCNL